MFGAALVALGLVAWTFPAWAAEEGKPAELHTIRFFVAATTMLDGVRYPILQEDGSFTDSEPLRFATGGRPELYEYRGSNPLVFYRKVGGGEKAEPETVARYRFQPEKKGERLLMFSPRNDDALPYGVVSVLLSRKRFDEGDLYVLNASDSRIAFRTADGGSRGIIELGDAALLPASSLPGALLQVDGGGDTSGDQRVQVVGVRFAARDGANEWQVQNLDILSAREGELRILLFSPPPVEGSARLRSALFTIDLTELRPEENNADGREI